MAKACNKPVRENPFTVYRDPKTGKWMVLKPTERIEENTPVLQVC